MKVQDDGVVALAVDGQAHHGCGPAKPGRLRGNTMPMEDELDLTVACRDCGGTGRLEQDRPLRRRGAQAARRSGRGVAGRAPGGLSCPTCAGSGRVDPVLWRKPEGSTSFRDLAFSSWPAIVTGEQYFGLEISPNEDQFGPNVRQVIALLRRGEPVPKYGQRFLADLLVRLTTPNKKPCKPPGQKEADDLSTAIAMLRGVADMRSSLASSGQPSTWTATYAAYAERPGEVKAISTIKSQVSTARRVVRNKIEEYERIFAEASTAEEHLLDKKSFDEFLAPLKALIAK